MVAERGKTSAREQGFVITLKDTLNTLFFEAGFDGFDLEAKITLSSQL